MAEDYSPEAETMAARLIGRMTVVAADKDEEDDDTFFSTQLSKLHSTHRFEVLAKCYQTLINEGKI